MQISISTNCILLLSSPSVLMLGRVTPTLLHSFLTLSRLLFCVTFSNLFFPPFSFLNAACISLCNFYLVYRVLILSYISSFFQNNLPVFVKSFFIFFNFCLHLSSSLPLDPEAFPLPFSYISLHVIEFISSPHCDHSSFSQLSFSLSFVCSCLTFQFMSSPQADLGGQR